MKRLIGCRRSIVLAGLLAAGVVSAASELVFDEAARPAKLVLGGMDLLAPGASAGFVLQRRGRGDEKTETRLSRISRSGSRIRAAPPEGTPSFTFQVDTFPNHIAIHLLNAEGIGTGRDCSLRLEFDSEDLAVYTLNDLMTENSGSRRRKNTVLSWPYLWGRPRPDGTLGSAVLYNGRLRGADRDAVLAEIWSVQGRAGRMVRPAGQASWTEADVLAWVDRWVEKFSVIAKVSVGAETPEELYEMTERFVIPGGANRVYLFSRIWRAGGQGLTTVHPRLFPKGPADLAAYNRYLAARGIHLQLKSLAPQIDQKDRRYISPGFVDTRLMRWADGTLAADIDAAADRMMFRIENKYLRGEFDGFVRVGSEIIHAERMTETGAGLLLEGCTRGCGGSTAQSHTAGSEMAGCVEINGAFNFEDDFGRPGSLAEEVCGEYGDFLNEMNVGHLHFDGTGRMGQYPWYVRDVTDYVYSRVEQPVTASRVGGSIPANFEKQFSAALAIEGAVGYRDIRIGPRLHESGRKHTEFATALLDLHFDVMDGIRLGSRRPAFLGGQSGAALSLDTLNRYGLTDEAFQLFKDWVVLAPVFDDADAAYLAGFLSRPRGHHYQGEDVLVLGKNGAGGYIFTPHRVLGRTSGEDAPFMIDQEWGAVPRFQHIAAGTGMELLNPYEAQEPQVVIHVKEGSAAFTDPLIRVNGGELAVQGAVEPNEYMKFEGGRTVGIYDENWNLVRRLPARAEAFTFKTGSNTVTTASGRGDAAALRVQYITRGPVYVLASNRHLGARAPKE